jgi:PAS domain S-box-containing protein
MDFSRRFYFSIFLLISLFLFSYLSICYAQNSTEIPQKLKLTPEESEFLSKTKVLRYSSIFNLPPYNFSSGDKLSGYTVDVLHRVADILGLEFKADFYPDAASYHSVLDSGKADIVGALAKTPARAGKMLFVGPFVKMSGAIASRNGIPYIRNIAEIKGRTVAVMEGGYVDQILENEYPGIKIIKCKTPLDVLKKVYSGEAELSLGPYFTYKAVAEANSLPSINVYRFQSSPYFDPRPIYLAVKKGNSVLKSLIEKSLDLIGPAEIEEVKRKWTTFPEHVSPRPLNLTATEKKFLNSHKVVPVFCEDDLETFCSYKDGKYQGFSVDMLQRAADNVGLELDFKPRLKPSLSHKSVKNAIQLNVSESSSENEELFYTEPFSREPWGILTNENTSELLSLKNLPGKKVAVRAKYTGLIKALEEHYPDIEIVKTSDLESSIKKLIQGDVDSVVGVEAILKYHDALKPYRKLVSTPVLWDNYLGAYKPVFGIRNEILKSVLQKGLNQIPEADKNSLRLKWVSLETVPAGGPNLTAIEKDYIADNPVVRILCEKDRAPINFIGKNGPTGYSVDYFKLLAERAGFKVEFINKAKQDLSLTKISKHEVDVVINAVSNTSWDKSAFFSSPYLDLELGLAGLKSNGIFDLEFFEGKKIGALRGEPLTGYISSLYPDIEISGFNNVGDMLAALSAGRVDAVAGYRPVLDYHIRKGGYNNLQVQVIKDKRLLKSGVGRVRMAIRKDRLILKNILQKSADTVTVQDLDILGVKWLSGNPGGRVVNSGQKVVLNNREKKFLADSKPLLFSERAWEPLSIIDENGSFSGIAADYLQLITARTGLRFKFVPSLSWTDVLKKYDQGLIDVVPNISSADNVGREMLLSEVFLDFPLIIVGRENSAYVNDLSQLNGRKVGVGRGYAAYNYLKKNFPGIDLVQTDTVDDGLIMLSSGEVDAFVGHAAVVINKIRKLGVSDLKIIGSTNYKFMHHIGVDPRYSEAVSIINKALSSISEEDHRRIYQKWLNPSENDALDYSLIWEIGGVALILLVFFMGWNRKLFYLNSKLNSEIKRRRKMELVHRSLHKIAMAVMDVGGIDEFYKVLHFCINEFMYADNFFVVRCEDSNDIQFAYCVDEHNDFSTHGECYLELSRYIIASGESAFIDREKMRRLVKTGQVDCGESDFEVWIGVPLIRENKVLGVISVQSYDPRNELDAQDLELLIFVSRYIMIALERMSLRDQSMKQTEELADREASFRSLFDSSGDGIVLMNLDFEILNANQSALKLYGCHGLEEFKTYSAIDLSAETQASDISSLELAKKYMLEVYTTGFSEFEWVSKKVDGTIWFASISLNLVNLKQGPAVQASIRDITETRQMRKDLERSISMMSATIESTADGILVLDPMDRPSVWNRRFMELWNIPADILESGSLEYLDILARKVENPDTFLAKIEEFRERPDDDSFDEVALIDGRVLERLSRPQRIGTNVVGRVWSFRDVTAQRMSESALLESHRRLNDIIEFLPDSTLVIDREGRVMAWNKAMEEITGIPKGMMLGKGNFEYAIPFYGERRPILIDMVLQDSMNDNSYLYDHMTSRGDIHYAEVYTPNAFGGKGAYLWGVARSLYNSNGEIVGSIECLRDITERRNTELDLERVSKEAEAAVRAKSEFLANMSHEIRTPMNSILGIGFLLGRTGLDNKQGDYLEKMMSSANSLLNIIDDILDFSKIEAGKMQVEKIEFRLDSVLRNVADIVAVKAEEKNLEFILYAEPDVPQHILGDPLRIGQILTNLTNNAIKFTGEGEIEIRVSLNQLSGHFAELRFMVRDTGIGLSAEEVGKLFQSFTQADTSITRKYGGTGLGLAICKTLVELMGGAIGVESLPGMGSTFFFDVGFELPENQPALFIPGKYKGSRVAVVDDNHSILDCLRSFLESMDFRVETMSSGAELKRSLEESIETDDLFKMAILDWKVGEELGVEHAALVREKDQYKDLPVILMASAGGDSELRGASIEAGIDVVVNKPLTYSALWTVVSGLLDRKREAVERTDGISPVESMKSIRGARILLVEDSHVNQIVALDLLENAGLRVSVVDNGLKAIEAVKKTDFDLVLMDIQMPEMDGLTAVREIRKDAKNKDLPIIAMTAHAMSGDREKSLAAGMNEHLTKPINPGLLYEELLKFISPGERIDAPAFEEREKSSDNIEFPEIPGLNVESGLSNVAGSRRGYARVLKSFKEDYSGAADAMRSCIENGDMNKAAALAHSAKGVAGNMGAELFLKAAQDLEKAIKSGSDNIHDSLAEYEKELNILINGLQNFSDTVIRHVESTDYNPLTVRRVISNLHSLLEEGNAMSVEVMEELRQKLAGKGVESELDVLSSLIDNYDFDDASRYLDDLEKTIDLENGG